MIPREELEDMYCGDGMTQAEIGNMVGVSNHTVSIWMKLYGIETRTLPEAHTIHEMIQSEELRSMYWDNEMSQAEIGYLIGVSQSVIVNWMRNCGIKLRTQSESILGKNNPNWNGGNSIKYCEKFNNRLREAVRNRDNYTCQNCGKIQEEDYRKLTVHHIHYDKENCYPDLITLCSSCHAFSSGNRDEWEELCMILLEDRGLLNWKPNCAK